MCRCFVAAKYKSKFLLIFWRRLKKNLVLKKNKNYLILFSAFEVGSIFFKKFLFKSSPDSNQTKKLYKNVIFRFLFDKSKS